MLNLKIIVQTIFYLHFCESTFKKANTLHSCVGYKSVTDVKAKTLH